MPRSDERTLATVRLVYEAFRASGIRPGIHAGIDTGRGVFPALKFD
jgi:hypothetical protein